MKETLSLEMIYEEYKDKVFSYIRNKTNNYQDAEDLCEDVFVKVGTKLDTYDSSKSALSTWIYNITKNTVVDYYRTHKDNLELLDNYDYVDEKEEEVCEDDLMYLAQALKQIDDTLKDIIIMRYYEDMSLKDIAEKLNMSYGIVKLRHKEALFQLKNLLKDKV